MRVRRTLRAFRSWCAAAMVRECAPVLCGVFFVGGGQDLVTWLRDRVGDFVRKCPCSEKRHEKEEEEEEEEGETAEGPGFVLQFIRLQQYSTEERRGRAHKKRAKENKRARAHTHTRKAQKTIKRDCVRTGKAQPCMEFLFGKPPEGSGILDPM